MAITVNYPSDKRRPGVVHEFDFVSGKRGLSPQTRRIALVGTHGTLGGGAVVDQPIQVFDEDDAKTKFGQGSELTLMCRMAFSVFRRAEQGGQLLGNPVQVWGVPVAAPGGGTAATGDFALTGSPTEDGDIIWEVAGRRFRTAVDSGDAIDDILLAMEADYNERLDEMPGTVADEPTGDTLDYTHRHAGVNGNDVNFRVVSAPAGLTVTPTDPSGGLSALTLTTALANLLDQQYFAVAISSHETGDQTAIDTHLDTAWSSTRKRYRHVYLAENAGSATAQSLSAAFSGDERVIVADYPSSPQLPSEMAAGLAAMSEMRERPNHNYDGVLLPFFLPPQPGDIMIGSEVESDLAAAVTPLTANEARTLAKMERLVTTRISPETLLDVGHSKTLYRVALDLDAEIQLAIEGKNLSDELLTDLRSIAYDVLKARETDGWLQNVDAHAAELRIERANSSVGRILVEIPSSIVPGAHQVVAKHVMFIE